jgi:hypothetical protein
MWETPESRIRGWGIFILWLGIAACSAYVDYTRRSTIALPVLLAVSVLAVYFGFRRQRPSRFKFELMGDGSGAVRSRAFGFEVRILSDRIEYRESEKVLYLQPQPWDQHSATFGLELPHSVRWNDPFDSEPIPESKRKEIFLCIVAALGFIQGSELARGRRRIS